LVHFPLATVFEPSLGLDPYSNSVRGARVCEEISERLGLHVIATEAEDTRREPALFWGFFPWAASPPPY
jgi:hypothetical protein